MTREEFFYPSSDGHHQIHALLWTPPGAVRGVVQIAHGMCEYAGRYEPLARFLTGRGFAVSGNDHLGHGQSVAGREEYGYFQDWWDLVRDARALRLELERRFPGLPCFLLGHSMGSFVARCYLVAYPGTVAGCLLSGTAYLPPWVAAAGQWLAGLGDPRRPNKLFYRISIGAYNRAFAPNRTRADWLSSDPAAVDAYLADPLCTIHATGAMDRAMMAGLRFVCRRGPMKQMDPATPIYLFSGDLDPVGNRGKGVRTVARRFRAVGCRDVTVRLYPGGRHEMLQERDRDQVCRDLLAWLEAHLSPAGAEGELSQEASV